jgi:hypothetical protein
MFIVGDDAQLLYPVVTGVCYSGANARTALLCD